MIAVTPDYRHYAYLSKYEDRWTLYIESADMRATTQLMIDLNIPFEGTNFNKLLTQRGSEPLERPL